MSEIYNQLGDAATIILLILAITFRNDFKPPAWTIAIPGGFYTLRWLDLGNTANAVTAAFFTAAAVTLVAWINHEPKTGGAR